MPFNRVLPTSASTRHSISLLEQPEREQNYVEFERRLWHGRSKGRGS